MELKLSLLTCCSASSGLCTFCPPNFKQEQQICKSAEKNVTFIQTFSSFSTTLKSRRSCYSCEYLSIGGMNWTQASNTRSLENNRCDNITMFVR